MDRRLATLALALVAVLMAACSGSAASAAPDAAALPGTSWTATSVGGVAVIAATPPKLTFGADGIVSGTTGCNSYSGSYKLDGGSITVGLLAMTMMLCQGPVGDQETAFSAALQSATAWSIGSDGSLTLTGAADILATPDEDRPCPGARRADRRAVAAGRRARSGRSPGIGGWTSRSPGRRAARPMRPWPTTASSTGCR